MSKTTSSQPSATLVMQSGYSLPDADGFSFPVTETISNTFIERHNVDAWKFISAMPDKSVDLILTDPLYDDKNIDINELMRVCKGHIIAFCDPMFRYFQPDEIHHWVKPVSTKNTTKRMSSFIEEILVLRQGDTYNHNLPWANYSGVWSDVVESENVHPFQKPLALIERLMRVYSNKGDVVFDPFFGSCVTGRAAKNLSRSFIGCEIDAETFSLSSDLGGSFRTRR